MATVDMVWSTLQSQITSAMNGTNPLVSLPAVTPLPMIGIDWPSEKGLKALAGGTLPSPYTAMISIFDRGTEKNETSAINLFYALPPVTNPPGAVITPNTTYLPVGHNITLTGSGIPIQNDAFCLVLTSGLAGTTQVIAQYVVPNNSTTLVTALTNFTAQINTLSGISAVLSDLVITVTNNSDTENYNIRAVVVNTSYFTQEGYRWLREIQVTVWTISPEDRSKYGNILEQLFTQMEVNYGFLTVDQSACRVTVHDDILQRDTQLTDLFRRDFLICVDYPVLYQAPAFGIETIPPTFVSPVPD